MKLTLEKSDFLGAVASSLCVIHCLGISWSTLFLLLLNEKLKLISLPEIAIYITGITLAALHIYNLKFCKCKTPHWQLTSNAKN